MLEKRDMVLNCLLEGQRSNVGNSLTEIEAMRNQGRGPLTEGMTLIPNKDATATLEPSLGAATNCYGAGCEVANELLVRLGFLAKKLSRRLQSLAGVAHNTICRLSDCGPGLPGPLDHAS